MPIEALRRGFVPTLVFFTVLVGCAGEPPSPPAATTPSAPPPIVLVSIDTLRSDRLPVYGYGGVETPALDTLAERAVVFERAWSPVPLTLPSHASIMTGLLPPQHGVRDNIGYRFDADAHATLARLLGERGYATAAAVSAWVLRGDGGLGDGFELYDDRIDTRRRGGVGGLQRPGPETLAAVLPWLEARDDEPFFLFLHLFEPHTPYAPPEPFASRFADPYDGEVAAADAVVGQLLDALDRLGHLERAAVVVLSDHGEGLGDHGEDEHGLLLYRESLQVPLVLKLPGGNDAGRRVTAPVSLVDVFPTLLELAGAPVPEGTSGVSLLRHLDASPPAARALYAETFYPRLHFGWSELTSLVEGRFHYIDGPDPELYDLESDPGETTSLLAAERRTAARLRGVLAGLEGELEAPSEVDEETRRALAALGYVGSGRDAGEDLPDPKSRLATVADLQEGLRLYALGELDGARAALERAVTVNPRSLDAWEYLGRSLDELGRPREALAAYERALDLAAGKATHLAAAAALILLRAGRTDDALALLRREILLAPDALALRLLEGRALAMAGRLDEAWTRADEAVAQAPRSADAVYLRGTVDIGRRHLDDAERDLRQALELSPDHTAAMSDLAVLMRHRGDLAEARRLLERVVELNPGDQAAKAHLRELEAMTGGAQ